MKHSEELLPELAARIHPGLAVLAAVAGFAAVLLIVGSTGRNPVASPSRSPAPTAQAPTVHSLPDPQGLAGVARVAAHESPRTTKLYDRTGDEITLDEVERIAI
jgi:hypothetical protein